MHDALLYLLIRGINERSFINESRKYGYQLACDVVMTDPIIDSSLEVVKDVFVREQKTIDESIDCCKWFVGQEINKDISGQVVKKACLSESTYDIVLWQLACASLDTSISYGMRTAVQDIGIEITSKN